MQQEILIQGKAPSYVKEGSLSSDLILLNLLQELRRDYPVRPIADYALFSMMIGMISRVIIDQAAFGPANQETRVEHILQACFGILFSKPVPMEQVQLIIALGAFIGCILFISSSIPFWNQLITYALGKSVPERQRNLKRRAK